MTGVLDWSSEFPKNKSASAALRERRQFAEVIVAKLDKFDGVEKFVTELQPLLIKMEGVMDTMFGMLASQQSETPWCWFIAGTTYYVEVPKIQYVDRIVEVPQFRMEPVREKVENVPAPVNVEKIDVQNENMEVVQKEESVSLSWRRLS